LAALVWKQNRNLAGAGWGGSTCCTQNGWTKLSWNQNSSTKKCIRLLQVIPLPGLQAILNKKEFTQYSDNIPAVLKLKLQHPNNILATENTVLQIKQKNSAILMLIQQLQ
jgi:hypothetical protein